MLLQVQWQKIIGTLNITVQGEQMNGEITKIDNLESLKMMIFTNSVVERDSPVNVQATHLVLKGMSLTMLYKHANFVLLMCIHFLVAV